MSVLYNWNRCKRLLLVSLVGTLAVTSAAPISVQKAAAAGERASVSPKSASSLQQQAEPYYADALKAWLDRGAKPAAATIEIAAANKEQIHAMNEHVITGGYGGKAGALQWAGTGDGYVEYRLEIPSDALYEIQVSYRPVTGKSLRRPAVWNVTLDGRRPFREASSITLYRQWKDAHPIKKDERGDDIRPKSEDVSDWSVTSLRDSGGAYAEPLQWFLAKGTHTLRIEGYEPVALEAIRLVPPQKLPSYAEVKAANPNAKPAAAEVLTLQAEVPAWKNDSSIQLVSDTDMRSVPLADGKISFNSIGGRRWWSQNQELTWSFDVPETGNYKLAMRTLQNTISQKASFRTIRIDGKAPFQEFLTYRFPYRTGWEGTTLQQDDGTPYELYLTKGTHTLSMTVTHAPFKPVIMGIEKLTDLLYTIDQDIRSLTGGTDDKNRTWKIEKDLPDLPPRIQEAAKQLRQLAQQTEQVNGRKDNVSQGFASSALDLEKLLEKVDDIPYHLATITSMEEKVAKFIDVLMQQPLQLDEIYVAPADTKLPSMEASWGAKVKGIVLNFYYTFQNKNRLTDMKETELNVWVHRGRDYVTQLQELTDELFTPETGIKVRVNLLPNPQLLVMANAAGNQPDVALGLTQDLPVDYAIRGSIQDLSQFSDFNEMYKRYSPGSWLPFYYNKGYYALPETQSFQVLFYRKDILERLNMKLPDTWEEVYDLLPNLQQNDMNFYVNPKEYMMFFFQNRSDIFSKDGMKTVLDSPESFQAFRQWTDMFNIYALEREVPSFYQHFRKGTMPIGISDYNMYIQLAAAAPEISGRWGIAPIPGTKQKDGTITRWAGGGQTSGVIFKASDKKDQAWAFMKWWNSAEVQERYGADLESFNGVSFRWNTSNIEAFTKLPWKREDANVILDQWRWYKDMPNLPGGYFVNREITNAWNRTVVDGMNYRNSLELAVMEIHRELQRKQQEFGFVEADGTMKQTLDLPVVDMPWEGVKTYGK